MNYETDAASVMSASRLDFEPFAIVTTIYCLVGPRRRLVAGSHHGNPRAVARYYSAHAYDVYFASDSSSRFSSLLDDETLFFVVRSPNAIS